MRALVSSWPPEKLAWNLNLRVNADFGNWHCTSRESRVGELTEQASLGEKVVVVVAHEERVAVAVMKIRLRENTDTSP